MRIFKITAVIILLAAACLGFALRFLFYGNRVDFKPDCVSAHSDEVLIGDSSWLSAIANARTYLLEMKNRQGIPGISVAVSIGDTLVWAEGFGCANLEEGRPVTIRSMFRVGSVSKTMTGMAIGRLYQEGKLDPDSPVSNYVPYFSGKKYDPTVRQLAGHQGGIRHYKGIEMLSGKHFASVKESIESTFLSSPLRFEPGTDNHYSSYGYVLISAAVEAASGQSFIDYMRKEIFEPLGMNHTAPDDILTDIPERVGFYTAKPGRIRKAIAVDLSNKWAGGGFLSTPTDLVTMVINMDELLDSATVNLLTAPIPYTIQRNDLPAYGFGWRITKIQGTGETIWHHGGTSIGGRAFLLHLVNARVTAAICSNSHDLLKKPDFDLQEAYNLAKLFIRGAESSKE